MKCHRTGKTVYPMDNPIKIDAGSGTLVFGRGSFTCAASGVAITLNNYTLHNGEVYHKAHVPTPGSPDSGRGSASPSTNSVNAPGGADGAPTSRSVEADVKVDAAATPSPAAPAVAAPPSPTDSPAAAVAVAPESATPAGGAAKAEVATRAALFGARVSASAPGHPAHRPKGTAESLEKFEEIQSKTADEQSRFFLMQFAAEFSGRSDEILERAEGFKRYLQPGESSLSEVDTHRLLEELGRARTYQEMREIMREIDQDSDNRVSLIEWLLFELDKTLDELYETKCPPELSEMMDKAIAEWRAVQAAKNTKQAEVAQLEALVAQGGVKGGRAAIRLAQIRDAGVALDEVVADVRADRQKARAEKTVEAHNRKTADEEAARVEEERRREEEDRRQKRMQGRNKLMAMAAMFGDTTEA